MSIKLKKLIKKFVLTVATITAMAPSFVSTYEPECPKQLKKFK